MTGKADIRKWDKKKKRNDSRNTVNSYQESRATKFTPQGSGNSELIRPQSEGDLNMNTFDIINLDRMIFATDAGAGDNLASTETGIEAIATGAVAYGMKYQVPANKIHQFFIGTSEKINITTGVIAINDNVTMGGYLDVNSNYIQFDEMTPTSVGTVPADERRLFSDSTNNSELSVKKSDGSVVSLESTASSGADTSLSNLTSTGEAHFANPTLSNLGTTSVNANIIPQAGKLLGSSGNEWSRVHSNNYRLGTAGTVSATSNDIVGNSTGMYFNVPSTKLFNFRVNDGSVGTISSSGTVTFPNFIISTSLNLNDATSYPGANGSIYREGNDVKIFSGGSEINMSTISGASLTGNNSFTGQVQQFYHVSGTFNALMPNVNFGLGGSSFINVLGDLKITGALNHDGSTVGFYGTTPISKQTSVAVTASGIHAALVSLGLIT